MLQTTYLSSRICHLREEDGFFKTPMYFISMKTSDPRGVVNVINGP